MKSPLLGLPDRHPDVDWAWQTDGSTGGGMMLWGTSRLTGETLGVDVDGFAYRGEREWAGTIETAMRGIEQLLHPGPEVLLIRALRTVPSFDAADAMEYCADLEPRPRMAMSEVRVVRGSTVLYRAAFPTGGGLQLPHEVVGAPGAHVELRDGDGDWREIASP